MRGDFATTQPLDLKKLRELAQAATPGPYADGGSGQLLCRGEDGFWSNILVKGANRAYLQATNPAVVLELLARLERAEAVVKLAATAWNDPYYYDRVGQAARAALAAAEKEEA